MNPDDFENRLARTPLNPPPAAWKNEILEAARRARLTSCETLVHPLEPAPAPGLLAALRAISARLSAPWPLFAAGWAVVLLLGSLNNAFERQHHQAAAQLFPATSRAAVLVAARTYRAQVAALTAADASDLGDATTERSSRPLTEERPRSDWTPLRPGARSNGRSLTLCVSTLS
jgi:hypothetical protein